MNALVLLLFLAQVPATVDTTEVPGYVVASEKLAVGGAPTARGLDLLRGAGVRTVVDVRAPEEAPDAEKDATSRGFRYVRVPVKPATFSIADVEAVERVLADEAAAPVYLHCASGNRTGAVWAVLRARAGAKPEDALADGERVGLRSVPMKEAAARLMQVGK